MRIRNIRLQLSKSQPGKDPVGAIAGSELAEEHHWKLGERLTIEGGQIPVRLELSLRGVFKSPFPVRAIYFNWVSVQSAANYHNDQLYLIQADSPQSVSRISRAVDNMFHNSGADADRGRTCFRYRPDLDVRKCEGLHPQHQPGGLIYLSARLGNTMAMSIRERTREVAMMRSLGFTPWMLQMLLAAETLTIAACSWIFGTLAAYALVFALVHSRTAGAFAVLLKIPPTTLAVSLPVAGFVGIASAMIPAHRASHINIVQGLRHVG